LPGALLNSNGDRFDSAILARIAASVAVDVDPGRPV